ncbi:hypothetical protein VP1G_04683 [Cytospora mali]|uniref:Uncharacterized protein n=1 Tax=Cytospora mali TaxID=578113 RepID=A0A194V0B5_CYTMA|nr:hypothetical protein VP1G_04683 [Valsa mali var. pyri (nom. inval.)]
MVLPAVIITMAPFSSLPSSLIIMGFLFAWLAVAQTQTVYLTQTVFTACECSASSTSTSASLLMPSAIPDPRLTDKPLSILTATPATPAMTGTDTAPAVVSILGGATPGIIVPSSLTSTLFGTFPPLSELSPAVSVSSFSLPSSWPEPMDSLPTNPLPPLSILSSAVSVSSFTLPSSWSEPMDSLPSNPSYPPVTTTVTVTTTEIPTIATVASIISLSNGLGPLLSTVTTSTSTYSSITASTASGGGTTIEPLYSMMAPTAPSSALTTSGIPPALSVNLSLVSSDMSLASSAALISFGTSSPAVFSSVLPSGVSLGTSSQTLTTYSAIALSSVYLTGVTVLAPRSPTSCFALPTPSSSMDLVAVAVNPQDHYDLSNPMLFSFGENATNPQYIGALASGDPYVLDLSSDNPVTGQLGLQIPGQNALVFDGSGMSLFAANCTSLFQVVIENFYSQLGAMSGLRPGKLGKRQGYLNTTNFLVEVSVDSYLNTPYFSPNLTFGNSVCTLQTNVMGPTVENITWSCVYPPPNGGATACADRLATWLDGMSVPSTAPQSPTEVLATLSPFLSLAGDSVLTLFPGSDPALSLGFAFMRQVEAAAQEAVGDVGSAACNVMHSFDSDDLVIEDSGLLGTKTLGSFINEPPPSLAINLAASATASIVILPRRKANPKDDFLKQIATDFASIFGPFVSWLHGLHPFGIFGMEETGMVHLPMPILTNAVSTTISTTTYSTTTLNSAQSIVHIQAPTVTVTHVLGEGWFSPSTYVVGPGTSTFPPFPALAMHGPATDHTLVDLSSVSSENPVISSTADSASKNIVQNVAAQLAAMDGDPGVRTGWHWGWPNRPSTQSEEMTSTTGSALGYYGHVVLVTTTVTEWMGST